MRFKPLHIPDTWKHYWTKYPEGYTMLESLMDWVSQVNAMSMNINDWNEYLEEFVRTFDEKLQDEVRMAIDILHKSGVLADIIQGEVFDNIVKRIEQAEDTSNEAKALAENPLGALMLAGFKVGTEHITPELQALIEGTSTINMGKGYYENNRGTTYPLKNVTRDGELHAVGEKTKNALLGATVIGAERGKMYQISYISNGFADSYGFTIKEFNTVGYASDSKAVERQMIDYRGGVMGQLGKPTGVTTRVVDVDGVTFIITVDYTDITEGGGLNVANTEGANAYGAVIDFNNYMYRQDALSQYRGQDFPLRHSRFRGNLEPINQIAKNAILDVKIFGAKVDRVYRLDFVGNGFESKGKKRYGITLSEYRKDDFEEKGFRTSYPFTYNDDESQGNVGNANYTPKSSGIDTITVDNGEIACSVTVDRRLIGQFINLNSNAPTAMIDPSNYFF